jgi:hypothetical protein
VEYARKRQDLLVFMTPMESEKEYEKLDAFLTLKHRGICSGIVEEGWGFWPFIGKGERNL